MEMTKDEIDFIKQRIADFTFSFFFQSGEADDSTEHSVWFW